MRRAAPLHALECTTASPAPTSSHLERRSYLPLAAGVSATSAPRAAGGAPAASSRTVITAHTATLELVGAAIAALGGSQAPRGALQSQLDALRNAVGEPCRALDTPLALL